MAVVAEELRKLQLNSQYELGKIHSFIGPNTQPTKTLLDKFQLLVDDLKRINIKYQVASRPDLRRFFDSFDRALDKSSSARNSSIELYRMFCDVVFDVYDDAFLTRMRALVSPQRVVDGGRGQGGVDGGQVNPLPVVGGQRGLGGRGGAAVVNATGSANGAHVVGACRGNGRGGVAEGNAGGLPNGAHGGVRVLGGERGGVVIVDPAHVVGARRGFVEGRGGAGGAPNGAHVVVGDGGVRGRGGPAPGSGGGRGGR